MAGTPLVLNIRLESPSALNINDNLNSAPNTCSFATELALAPVIGQPFTIIDPEGFGTLFGGNVQSYDMDFENDVAGADAVNHLIYTINGIDPTWLLNSKLPYGSFSNISATSVVKSLVARFAPLFTTVNVQASLPPITMTINRTQNFATVLSAIAQLVGCVWKVDYNYDVHFYFE